MRRADFPLLVRSPDLHYLDSAATAQKAGVVLDAIRTFYETSYANPHRGAYSLATRATDAYHAARSRIGAFFGVADPASVIFTRGTTEAINLLATAWGDANVRRGDEIIITRLEHHSNFVPWQQLALRQHATLRIAELTADGQIDLDHLRHLMAPNTKVVAVAHVSNVLGSVTPLEEIGAIGHSLDRGTLVVVDGAQGAPHRPVAFDSLDIDAYTLSGHKLGGPMGIGAMLARRSVLESLPPYQTGGGQIEFVHDDHTTWAPLPLRFEAGTPNVAGAVGLAAAIEYLDDVGLEEVIRHERMLTILTMRELGAIDGVELLGPPAAERAGVVSFTLAGIHPHDLATILDQDSVCIRAGHHCAQPLMRALRVPATARASFAIYSDEADVAALVAGVRRAQALFGTTASEPAHATAR